MKSSFQFGYQFDHLILCKNNVFFWESGNRSVFEFWSEVVYWWFVLQVVPHITDAIQEWVETVAYRPVDGEMAEPEVCIIELGGTIGDIEGMPFVEAFRQFQFRVKVTFLSL